MLKEVGSSGQISLGKRYAGSLFQVIFHPDGRIEMLPMKVVPAGPPPADVGSAKAADGWLPPGGYSDCSPWALENRAALDAYAKRIHTEGTAAERLDAYLAQTGTGESTTPPAGEPPSA